MKRKKFPRLRGKALGQLLATLDIPEYITVAEAAKLMSVGPQRIRQICLSGALEARKVGRDWLIPRQKFLEYASQPHPVGRPKRLPNGRTA